MKQKYFITLLMFIICLAAVAQCPTLSVTNAAGAAGPICNGSAATLTATHNGQTLVWYNSVANGTQMGTGSPFVTGQLGANASFWAESQSRVVEAALSGGGKPAKTSNGSSTGASATTPWGLSFTVTQEFVLNSVDVYLTSGTAGDVTVNLTDANYDILQTTVVSVPAGGTSSSPVQYSLPLNFTITPGTYRLLAPLGHPAMNRDLGTNAFPYAVGSVATITGGTINNNPNSNSGVYYFFYNWNYSPVISCTSPRVEVAVQVKAAVPAPTGSTTQTFTEGQTLADLVVTGNALSWFANNGGTVALPDTTPLVNNTTYFVRQTVDGCNGSMLPVTVNQVAGLNDLAFSNLKVYPNPIASTLSIANLTEISAATVYNMQGQKVWSSNKEVSEINFSGFAPGVYIVHLISGGQTKNIKVTKE